MSTGVAVGEGEEGRGSVTAVEPLNMVCPALKEWTTIVCLVFHSHKHTFSMLIIVWP